MLLILDLGEVQILVYFQLRLGPILQKAFQISLQLI